MPTVSPLKKLPRSRTQCTVTFTADESLAAESAALQKLGAEVTVPGFRQGKAPADMLRRRVSPDQLTDETVRSLLPAVLNQLLKDGTVKPILPPRVDILTLAPLSLTITLVEKPEVKMGHIDTKSLKKTEPKFDEKDVERMVQYLLQQYRTVTPVEREAREGDQVTMNFVGHDKDQKEIMGTRSTNYQVVLGSKTLLPGFEDNLTGLKKGDAKKFDLIFPETYHAEHLRGKPVTFSVDVTGIEEVKLPDLTADFVKEKQLGDSPEDLRKRIADSMRDEEERADRQRREQAAFDAIGKATKVDLAPELVEQEQRGLLEELRQQLEAQKLDVGEWLKRSKRTMESLQKELKEEATKRVTLRFGVQQLLEDRKIELTPEELKSITAEALDSVTEEHRVEAARHFGEGGEGYEEMKWRKRVDKLLHQLLEVA